MPVTPIEEEAVAQPDSDRLCREWNPGWPATPEDTAVASRERTRTWGDLADLLRAVPPGGVACPASVEASSLAGPRAAFTLPADAAAAAPGRPGAFEATLELAAGIEDSADDPPGADEAGPPPDPDPTRGGGRRFPRPGDGIAGFRLISELGRGTFGRVFLAEESLLGNRLVALKVTKAEGDEPRILARLQHTNIVPIHSVHDDPRTRLRVICMPYVGGANLAQVLEAAAFGRHSAGGQRSLLKALDVVGLPPPSETIGSGGTCRLRPLRSSRATPAAPERPDAGDLPPPLSRRALRWASRWSSAAGGEGPGTSAAWSLLGPIPRWSRSIVAAPRSWSRVGRGEAGERDRDRDRDRDRMQPARRFLREASFVRAAAWIMARLAEGLEHAHARGLLHRDLKPSNILIAADGTPMLLDFNLAADASAKATEDDKVRMGGTLPYMSPEHLDAFHPDGTTPPEGVDERSDIYALGLILFEMIAGHRPFEEPDAGRPVLDAIRMMIADRRRGAPSVRAACPGVPRDLDAVIGKALHPDPDRRYARAGDLAEDLRRFLDDLPLLHAIEPSLRGRAAKWARRNPRATGATTVGLVGLALILGLGAASWSVRQHLAHASARLRLSAFQARFPECQLWLNTVGGPAESLGRGIALAEDTLAHAGIAPDPARTAGDRATWLDGLPTRDQVEARRDIAEVILLLARARVYLADASHSAARQREAAATAVAWLDRAEAIDPVPNATLLDDRAGYLDRIGRPDRAAIDRARRDRTRPATGRDFYLIGTALLARGETDRAEVALIKATNLSPRGFWPWFALGLCHYDQGRFAESAGDFAVCSVLSPEFAWPWMNRGLALAKVGRLIEARAAYDRAVEADETMANALANRGLVALELDDAPAAVADLERALALGLRDANVRAALGEALGRDGRRAEALRLLDDMVARQPDAVLPRIARGTVLADVDPARAEADFRHILAAAPRHAAALLGLARLERLHRPREALDHALRSLEADPNRVDAVELVAWLRGKLGDPAVVDSVERLAAHPTAKRLYNAGCSLALYLADHPDDRLAERAIGYLGRAVRSGIPAARLREDPDLACLRELPSFRELAARAPAGPPPGDP